MKRSKIRIGSIQGLSTTVSLLALMMVGSVAQAQTAAPQEEAPATTAPATSNAQQASGTVAPSADPGQVADVAPAADAAAPGDIVVTGVRASLQSAQNIKRNSVQIGRASCRERVLYRV